MEFYTRQHQRSFGEPFFFLDLQESIELTFVVCASLNEKSQFFFLNVETFLDIIKLVRLSKIPSEHRTTADTVHPNCLGTS